MKIVYDILYQGKKKKIHNETIYHIRNQSLIIKTQYAPSIWLVPKSMVTDT